ncbi:MAG: phage terminase large subunit [Candidatus Nanopelagicales bacterium]|nr:phage terminase large subunit [Candidatus Nanopelagicales bacterium]
MIAAAEPSSTGAERRLVVRGAMRALWQSPMPPECLLDGPAGTGKSWAVCARLVALCIQHPGIRVLLARKTRSSMSQSILVTWERVLDLFGQGAVHAGAGRQNRSAYTFANGSEVAVLGFDDPERIKSSEYDVLYVNEATELAIEDWEIATSRLRHNRMGWHSAIGDCNPGAPNHWANRRASDGAMVRLLTRHADNPALHDGTDWTEYGKAYLARLQALTGARRSRLLLGLWVAAEGAVFEECWDAARHANRPQPDPVTMRGHVAAVDWGYRDPNVLQVWGYDNDKRMYRLREIYRSETTLEWFAAQARCIQRDYPGVTQFVCDPSGKANIEQWVMWGLPAVGADRSQVKKQDYLMPTPLKGSIEVGIQSIEERLKGNTIAYCRDALGCYVFPRGPDGNDDFTKPGVWQPGRDEKLAERGHPVCTEDEYPLYAYPKADDGKPIKEIPVDMFNHGIDTTRYAEKVVQTITIAAPRTGPAKSYDDPEAY